MKRVIVSMSVLFVVSSLVVGFLGCSEDQESVNVSTVSVSDQKSIEQNIDIFIKAQYQAVVDRKTEGLQQTLAGIVASPEQVRGIANVAKAISEGSALDGKPYKFFQTGLRFNHAEIQIAENRAQITVTETTQLGLGLITSDFVLEHLIILERKDGDWKIAEDRILNLPGSPTIQDSIPILDDPAQSSQSAQLAPAGTTYQRSSAANYARCYALGYNPAYRNWIPQNADCTNFVSQCVRAGGWPMKIVLYCDNTNAWWYDYIPGRQTPSWIGAHDFFVFTIGNGRGNTSSEANMQAGDILSIDYEPDGRINHQMIFSRKDSVKGLLLCGHTTARYETPLNPTIKNAVRVEQKYPNAIFYYVKLRDTF